MPSILKPTASHFKKLALACSLLFAPLATAEIKLSHISTYASGIFDQAACEIGAYDPITKQLFVSNGADSTLFAFAFNNPTFLGAEANFRKTLDPIADEAFPQTGAEGATINSVAAYDGLVACAIQIGTDLGYLVFYNASDLEAGIIKTIEIPPHPDATTFSHDGRFLVVAGEAEAKGEIDPDGTVTIIDFDGPASVAKITADSYTKKVADFTAYNGKEHHLRNKGIRIFQGNGDNNTPKSASADLEPEYVAISSDNTLAYVTLQEANAMAIVDLAAGAVIEIAPFGWKDHSKGRPVLTKQPLDVHDLPVLGLNPNPNHPSFGKNIHLGGFSGLTYDASESYPGQDVFYAIPDRGPNGDTIAKNVAVSIVDGVPTENHPPQPLRPFYVPDYESRIVKLIVNAEGKVTLGDQILLTQADGTPISGKGNIEGIDEVPVAFTSDTASADYLGAGQYYKALPYDPMGGDFEGIVRDENGNFWMCDEYRPALYQFNKNGVLLHRYVAAGTDTEEAETYGQETLPAHYAKRWANRGFEGLAYDPDKGAIYAWIQSPLDNPNTTVRNKTDVIRIIEIDATDGAPVAEYLYLLQRNRDSGYGSRVDKIGDACWAGKPNQFYTIERDSSLTEADGQKFIFEIDLTYATNVLGMDESEKTFEQMTADELAAAGIRTAWKNKILNLPSIGYTASDKAEGITLLPDGSLAVINDNDFGTDSAGISDIELLGRIHFMDDYGLDASNRDDSINIQNWPALGMFMPDAIANFTDSHGHDYYITANEGDSRAEDDGFLAWDEARVKDLDLDPTAFPDAAELQKDKNLGRLKTIVTDGDLDGDGDFDRIFSYGARSFTIWDRYGSLVWDSGDQFAKKIAELQPDYFNADGTEFDGRSDDKGPEPEGIATGVVNGSTYAFIGLERQSAIMVYNIDEPTNPQFVQFLSNTDFTQDVENPAAGDIGPEGILFISAAKSPNGKPLLVVTNEVSGSVSAYLIDDSDDTGDDDLDGISNREEREIYHTDPKKADTDGDTIRDKDEIAAGLDPNKNDLAALAYFNSNLSLLPDAFSLAEIKNLAFDDVVIEQTEAGTFVASFKLASSDDAQEWEAITLNAENTTIEDGKVSVTLEFESGQTSILRFVAEQ